MLFQPSDLEKELNNVAFKSQLGEFALYSFEPSDMASREELFSGSLLRVVVDAKRGETGDYCPCRRRIWR